VSKDVDAERKRPEMFVRRELVMATQKDDDDDGDHKARNERKS
jgi:hypothetical protein